MKTSYLPLHTPNKYRSEKIIKIEERKSSEIHIENDEERKIIEIFYDGFLIINQTACDRIIICDVTKNISAIELKGSNLNHAMKQIEKTYIREELKNYQSRKTAVIVYSHSPSNINSSKQNFQEKMRREYNAKVFFKKNKSHLKYVEIL